MVLVQSRGRLLEKGELMKRLWPDSFVEEANLSHHVFTLRKALSNGENGATYIETVPKHGYRFIGDVKEWREDGIDSTLGMNSRSYSPAAQDAEESPQLEPVQREKSTASEIDLSKPASWATKKKGLAALLFLGALITGILLFKSGRDTPGRSALEGVRSIAVLPFTTIGLENGDEFVGLAMADALITRLGSLDRIIVRPTSAISKYKEKGKDPLAAGRELRVDAVLAGSTQRSGDRMRLTVQLLRTGDGRTLWTGKFDEKATDLFALEDSVAEAVARSLLLKLTAEQERQLAPRRYTEDIVASNSYVKGRYFLEKWELKKARECFEHAIDRDPHYALAYLGLGDVYLSSFSELPADVRRSRGLELVSRALTMDETLAEGHISLAMVKVFYDWDWAGALTELQRAIRLNPNLPWAHLIYARYWQALGRLDRAVAEIKRAQELDPLSVKFLTSGADISVCASQYDQAIQQFKMALDIDPKSWAIYEELAQAYELAGMDENALSARQKAFSLSGENELLETLNEVYARHGYKEARRVVLEKKLSQLEGRSQREYVPPIELALLCGRLGYKDQTLKWLEKMCEEREFSLFIISHTPEFAHLRTEPRFLALLKKMNMPAEVVLP